MSAPRGDVPRRRSNHPTFSATTTIGTQPLRSPWSRAWGVRRTQVLALDLHVLVGRERAHPDIGDRVLGDARTDPHQRAQIHDRREHRPVDRQLLDFEQKFLALFGVALAGLLPE